MELKNIEQEVLVINPTDKDRLVACLKYCRHRLKVHLDAHYGCDNTKGMSLNFIDYTIKILED